MVDRPLPQNTSIISAFGLALAIFTVVLDFSVANVSIPYITGGLGSTISEGTFVITAFATGNSILLPLTGWLVRRIGLVHSILICLSGFVFASWSCGHAPSLTMLIIARFFQGMFSGPIVPLAQSILATIFPKDQRTSALAFSSAVLIVAPIFGPIVGGWISVNIDWRWIFYINIPVGIFCIFIIHQTLRKYETPKEPAPLDLFGTALLIVGVSSLQYLLDKGKILGWLDAPIIGSCMIVSLTCFCYFIWWQLQTKHPLINFEIFQFRTYVFALLFTSICFSSYFGSLILLPLWLQKTMGYTATWAGVAMAPIGFASFLLSKKVTTLVDTYGPLVALTICSGFFALSSFESTFFYTEIAIYAVLFSRFLFGFAILFLMIPLSALALRPIPTKLLPQAAGVFHFTRAIFGGIGTSVFTTLWTRRTSFHYQNLASHVADSPLIDHISIGESMQSKYAFLDLEIDRQASTIALNDCFWAMGWIFLILFLITLSFTLKKSILKYPL